MDGHAKATRMPAVESSVDGERPVATVYNRWTQVPLNGTHGRGKAPIAGVPRAWRAAGLVPRRVDDDLRRFKKLIEQRDAETGAWRGRV